LYIWITLAVVVVLDRLSKILVQSNMSLGESIPVIPHFFHLTYILNSGAAFGMLSGKRWFFIISSILVLGVIIYIQRELPSKNRLMRFCMGLIGGGALGNLLDRLFVGKVIDFLDFKVWSYIFNIADAALVVGAILLAFLILRQDSLTKRDSEKEAVKQLRGEE